MGVTNEVSMPTKHEAPPEGPQRPEHIPEKFWNAKEGKADYDGLAKSYTELQSAFSKVTAGKPTEPKAPKEVKQADEPLNIPEGTPEIPKGGAFTDDNFNKWAQEWKTNGVLSEDTYKEIPVPRPVVDQWIAGQAALAQLHEAKIYEATGGKESLTEALQWARENFTQEERDVYNKATHPLRPFAEKEAAVKGLYARYTQAEGQPAGRSVKGRSVANPGGEGKYGLKPFENPAQLSAAMRDPRYRKDSGQTDPAYIKEVERLVGLMR